jgi:hypothetical protein
MTGGWHWLGQIEEWAANWGKGTRFSILLSGGGREAGEHEENSCWKFPDDAFEF